MTQNTAALVVGNVKTPAFIYDESLIVDAIGAARAPSVRTTYDVLFAVKAFPFVEALEFMAPHVDGFATSSVFEARLAREATGGAGSVHVTTPALTAVILDQLNNQCDYVTFNSLSQWARAQGHLSTNVSYGLRVNPGASWVVDIRYDPCRPHSKLGVPLSQLEKTVSTDPQSLEGLNGLLFHSNCDSDDLDQLFETVEHIDRHLGGFIERLEWVNLGGGYLFDEVENTDGLVRAVDLLSTKYNVRVFIEPGASLVRSAGSIVASVVDLFDSAGVTIAVLDTTVNHMPEVFEYGFRPDVANSVDTGKHEFLLAGATCLAGDLFGTYRFDEPLEIGSHVVFEGMGAYTLPKAHMFNGVNLPTIYARTLSGELELKREFTYEDYATRWRSRVPITV